jgi:hypothetical protein
MKHRKINLKDGLDLLKFARPAIAPNPGFMIQLKAYEWTIFNNMS